MKRDDQIVGKTLAIVTALALAVNAVKPFVKLVLEFPQNGERYLTQSAEAMKISNYGDCNSVGYGYIKKVISSIPDPSLFPVTRYSTYNLFPDVLFSDSRYRYNDTILIGIDLSPEDTHEVVISQAALSNDETNSTRSVWTFQTGWDYDLLTGFTFHFKDKSLIPADMVITLYDSAKNFVEIGKWTANVPDDLSALSFSFKLENPIEKFSFGRGGTDFFLLIETASTTGSVQVRTVEVLGVKVDLSDYTIFHRDFKHDGRCFAAVKNSFLEEVQKSNSPAWKKYLEEVSNVDFRN